MLSQKSTRGGGKQRAPPPPRPASRRPCVPRSSSGWADFPSAVNTFRVTARGGQPPLGRRRKPSEVWSAKRRFSPSELRPRWPKRTSGRGRLPTPSPRRTPDPEGAMDGRGADTKRGRPGRPRARAGLSRLSVNALTGQSAWPKPPVDLWSERRRCSTEVVHRGPTNGTPRDRASYPSCLRYGGLSRGPSSSWRPSWRPS
jgi:hypothetical protein